MKDSDDNRCKTLFFLKQAAEACKRTRNFACAETTRWFWQTIYLTCRNLLFSIAG